MQIPFRGQIDADVLRRTRRTALTLSRPTLFLGSVGALVLIWGQAVPLFQGKPVSWDDGGPVLLFVLFFAGLAVYSLVVAPRRILQGNALRQSTIAGTASESGIRIETELTPSDLPWNVFFKRKVGKDIVLLYQSLEVVNIFPRELFATETDWQDFVDLVDQNVPDAAPRGRGGSSGTLRIFWIWMMIFLVTILLWSLFHK
jgi:hypothetical protein